MPHLPWYHRRTLSVRAGNQPTLVGETIAARAAPAATVATDKAAAKVGKGAKSIVATTDARAVLEVTLVGKENLPEGEPKDAEMTIRLQRIANPVNLDGYGSALCADIQTSVTQQRAITQARNLMTVLNLIITEIVSTCNNKVKRFNKDVLIPYPIVLTFLFQTLTPF